MDPAKSPGMMPPYPTPIPSPCLGGINTIECIYCHASIYFVGIPATGFEEHLFKEHNILYDADNVIERTIKLQRPDFWWEVQKAERKVSNKGVQVDIQKGSENPSNQNFVKFTPRNPNSQITTTVLAKIDVKLEKDLPEIPVITISESQPNQPSNVLTSPGNNRPILVPSIVKNSFQTTESPFCTSYNQGPENFSCQTKSFLSQQGSLGNTMGQSSSKPDLGSNGGTPNPAIKNTAKVKKPGPASRTLGKIKSSTQQVVSTPNNRSTSVSCSQTTVSSSQNTPSIVKNDGIVTPVKSSNFATPSISETPARFAKPAIFPAPANSATPGSSATPSPNLKDTSEVVVKIPWYAGCEYRCQICSLLYFYNQDLRAHVKKEHGCPDKYLDRYNEYETNAVFLNCRYCNTNVKRHYSSFRNHLQTHNLIIEQYTEMFDIELEYECLFKGPIGHVTQPDGSPGSKRPASSNNNNSAKRRKLNVSAKVDITTRGKEWYDSQEYKCFVGGCTSTIYEPQVFVAHIESVHNINLNSYVDQYPLTSKNPSWYTCLLCDMKLKHQKSSIERHLAYCHEMTLEKYAPLLGPKNSSIAKATPDTDQSDFSIWSTSKCLYICCICAYETNRSKDFWEHAQNSHSLSREMYNSKHGDPCLERVMHECMMCYKLIRHDPSVMEVHMTERHHKTLKEYYEKLNQINPEKKASNSGKRTKPGPKSKSSGVPLKQVLEKYKTNSNIIQKSNNASSLMLSDWRSACSYECQICFNYVGKLWCSLLAHVRKDHGISSKAYGLAFGRYTISQAVIHKCLICNHNVQQTITKLRNHMNTHKISIEMYFECYVLKYPPKKLPAAVGGNKCEICLLRFSKDVILKEHIVACHGQDVATYESAHGKIQGMPLISAEKISSEEDKVFLEWSEKCFFECSECQDRTIKNKEEFVAHVETHGLDYDSYLAKHQKNSEQMRKVFHTCKICEKKVLHRTDQLVKHMSEHGISAYNYFKTHIEPKNLEAWMDACEFVCGSCGLIMNSLGKLSDHRIIEHRANGEHTELIWAKQTLHTCKICQIQIFQESEALKAHFAKHGITPKDYFEIYVLPKQSKTDNGVVESYNKCTFQCKICNEKGFKSSATVKKHILDAHSLSHEEYESRFGDMFLEFVSFSCPTCKLVIAHDSGFIADHMLTHSISFEEFIKKKKPTKQSTSLTKPRAPSKFSWNMNQNNCRLCGAGPFMAGVMWKHVVNNHGMEYSAYLSQFPPMDRIFHKCLHCNILIVMSRSCVTKHLKRHNLSIQEYEKIYEKDLKVQFDALEAAVLRTQLPVAQLPLLPLPPSLQDLGTTPGPISDEQLSDDIDAFIANQGALD